MKISRIILILVLMSSLMVIGSNAYSQKTISQKDPKKEAARFVNRTNKILFKTAQLVKEKKVYTGYLSRAKQLQLKAIQDFKDKDYKSAIQKSQKARRYAKLAFVANGGVADKNNELKPYEKKMVDESEPQQASDESIILEVTETDKSTEVSETGVVEDVTIIENSEVNNKDQGKKSSDKKGKVQK